MPAISSSVEEKIARRLHTFARIQQQLELARWSLLDRDKKEMVKNDDVIITARRLYHTWQTR